MFLLDSSNVHISISKYLPFFGTDHNQIQIQLSILIPVYFLIRIWEEGADEFAADRIVREVQIIRGWAVDLDGCHLVGGRDV